MVAFAKVAAFEVDDLAFFGDLAGEGCRDDHLLTEGVVTNETLTSLTLLQWTFHLKMCA